MGMRAEKASESHCHSSLWVRRGKVARWSELIGNEALSIGLAHCDPVRSHATLPGHDALQTSLLLASMPFALYLLLAKYMLAVCLPALRSLL